MNLPYGMFGENFTTEGLFEDGINIGDRFRIGEAELIATQPRLPCYKLGIKFGTLPTSSRDFCAAVAPDSISQSRKKGPSQPAIKLNC
jgi:hypothetical protein